MPNTALYEAEKQAEPWAWLAKYVKNNPVEWWFEGPAWDHRSDCERYEREGFRQTGIGVYSAPAATRRETKIREVCFLSQVRHKQEGQACIIGVNPRREERGKSKDRHYQSTDKTLLFVHVHNLHRGFGGLATENRQTSADRRPCPRLDTDAIVRSRFPLSH